MAIKYYDYGIKGYLIEGTAGDDTIENGGVSIGENIIYGGDGDDLIELRTDMTYQWIGYTSIYGEKGNDTIICNLSAYPSNTVSGGLDDDYISLQGSSPCVVQYAEGDGNDTIAVGDGGTRGITLLLADNYSTVASGDDMLVKVGEGSILFVGGVDETVTITGGTTTNPTDNSTPQETDDGNESQNGEGVTVSGTTINLDNNFDGDMLLGNYSEYNNIKVINAKANSDNKILVGNSNSNSIVGGNGRNSLWGGASGNNTLTGGTARDQFWYGGNGNDVVTNFSAGNSTNNDVVVLFGGALSKVSRSGSDVTFNMANGNSLNLKTNSSSAEDVIQYSTDGNNIFGAKIGASDTKSLNYDKSVNYFQLNGGGTLNVTGSGENNVWLDGSQGQAFSGINNIAATGTGRNILVGNGGNNSITGGSGSSSLWGGNGGNDVLTGGSGTDVFFYGKSEGADIINNASSSDVINMYDVRLSDFVSADISGKTFSFGFGGGNSLQINSSENLSATFNLADGSWKYNHSSGNWQNA